MPTRPKPPDTTDDILSVDPTALELLHLILFTIPEKLERGSGIKLVIKRNSIHIADQGSKNAGLEDTDNEYAKEMMQEDKNKKLINDYFNQLSQEEQLFLKEFVKELGLPDDYLSRNATPITTVDNPSGLSCGCFSTKKPCTQQ